MKRNTGLIAVVLATAGTSVVAQQAFDYSSLEIRTTDLGNGVYLLNWRGGDSRFLVGDDGVLLVDTSVAQMGPRIKAAVAKVSTRPIKLVINAHARARTTTRWCA